ncbi:hypothetical protein CCR75_003940 [Bremia lactucae]|uniref:Uncharacterized protein n=1 Tax=Bremia lactucae TaxID=4779 RepID=A0A976FN25_BRELC|nr:hypothetical protein CCR75_003940 [Bremia lactucae]
MEQTPKVLHPGKRVRIVPKYLDDYYVNATMMTSDQSMNIWHETMSRSYVPGWTDPISVH